MTYTDLGTANVTTLSGLFVYISQEVPIFIPMMLLSLFLITLFASYYAQQRARGEGNFWGSFAVSGYLVSVVSVVMSLIPDLINPFYVVVCIVIAIIGTGILMSKDNDY